jgi:chromosome segregation ATPase
MVSNDGRSDSSIDRLLAFISQISENYGKLLILIQSLEQAIKSSSSLRDIEDLRDKITSLKDSITELKETLSSRSETFSQIREAINMVGKHLDTTTRIINKMDTLDFREHMKDVTSIKEALTGMNCSEEIRESHEILLKVKKFMAAFTEKKKIIVAIIVFIWIGIQLWEKIVKLIEFLTTK